MRDDFPVWSDRFDRELTDVFVIQDEIARGIVNGLRLKLGHGRRRYESSVEAYDAYLRAQALVTGEGLPAYERSVGLYVSRSAARVTSATVGRSRSLYLNAGRPAAAQAISHTKACRLRGKGDRGVACGRGVRPTKG